jgi:hypothetical protein
MIISPLNALDMIPDGNDLEAVEIRLLKLDPVKPFGNGTIQSAFAEDASGHKASVRFMDFDPLGAEWIGPWMRINATRNGKNELTGLSVDSYNNRKRLNVKGVDQHGRNRVTIDWLEGVPVAPAPAAQPARQGPPAHRTDIVYDNHPQQPARQPMGPPPRQSGPPPRPASPIQQAMSQPPAQPRPPAGPHGATVGMAVKEAFAALVKGVRPEAIADEVRNRVFWQDVHQAASEILHVCKALESGDIAPSIVTAALPDYPAEEAAAAEEPWPQD